MTDSTKALSRKRLFIQTHRNILLNARDEGRLVGRRFLQSLIDQGDEMGREEAAEVFSIVALGETTGYLKSTNAGEGLSRYLGFLSCIGETLWESTAHHRQLAELVCQMHPAKKGASPCGGDQ